MDDNKDDKNVIDFPHTLTIKFPNTVLNSPVRDLDQEEAFEEIEEKYPDLEKKITDPDVLDRLAKVLRVCAAERRMGKFKDTLAMLIWDLVPELKRSNMDLYFIYRDRVFLICWRCLCVWAPIVEGEKGLPENFGTCPNGCNQAKVANV